MTGARARPGRSPAPTRTRIAAPGTAAGEAGFTLIEVLAVVAESRAQA